MTTSEQLDSMVHVAPVVSAILQSITFLLAIVTFIVVYRQLRTALRSVRLSTMMHRRDLYIGLTTTLPDKDVETMLLHVFDHFDKEVYLAKYRGNLDRIKSYLLMKRKYLYLILTTNLQPQGWDPGRSAPGIWLEELCKYEEFRDVHASQGHYYPEFKDVVDRVMKKVAAVGWALDTPEVHSKAAESVSGAERVAG